MPIVSWKNYNPNPIIERIEACRKKNSSGSAKFEGFEFHQYEALICSMLKFPDGIPEAESNSLVRRAIFSIGGKGCITKANLLAEINKLTKGYLSQSVTRYVLVTSLSLKYVEAFRRVRINDALIIFERVLASRYQAGRMQLMVSARHSLFTESPTSYLPVRVHISARTPYDAVNKASYALNLLRGIWNWAYNRGQGFRISFNKRDPVNKIVLGPIHTIHHLNGKLATETWWYEPHYYAPCKLKDLTQDIDALYEFSDIVRAKLSMSEYQEDLEQAIIRYGLALDERDWETAFLNLWSCLEDLTATAPGNSYKETIRRASFLFKDREYHRQVLTCLKDYRNRFIHNADDSIAIETYLYQLKNYVEALLRFHLFNRRGFSSLATASQFLDLPSDEVILRERVELTTYAQKFLGHI